MDPAVQHHSRCQPADRRIEHEWVLELHGDKLHVLRLEGFIFFGTANHLYEKVKALLKPGPNLPIEYFLLDFSLVHGARTRPGC